jgi:hypothetical protein
MIAVHCNFLNTATASKKYDQNRGMQSKCLPASTNLVVVFWLERWQRWEEEDFSGWVWLLVFVRHPPVTFPLCIASKNPRKVWLAVCVNSVAPDLSQIIEAKAETDNWEKAQRNAHWRRDTTTAHTCFKHTTGGCALGAFAQRRRVGGGGAVLSVNGSIVALSFFAGRYRVFCRFKIWSNLALKTNPFGHYFSWSQNFI